MFCARFREGDFEKNTCYIPKKRVKYDSKWWKVGESGGKDHESVSPVLRWKVVVVMFMGQYEHSIDVKGRTIIPVKYREELGESFVVTRGLDGCLYLYPAAAWQEFADKLKSLPSNLKNRQVQRQFLSKAMEVSLDKQGRILIPAMLRELAGLEKDIAFVGMMNHVEIWDKNRLEQENDSENAEMLETAMDELDISL